MKRKYPRKRKRGALPVRSVSFVARYARTRSRLTGGAIVSVNGIMLGREFTDTESGRGHMRAVAAHLKYSPEALRSHFAEVARALRKLHRTQ